MQRAVLHANVARARALEMRATRMRARVRQTFDQWDAWTTHTVNEQEAEALAIKHFQYRLASTCLGRWAGWTEERVLRAQQIETARTHWESVAAGNAFDAWARAWQLAQNGRDMRLSVARAHWRLKVVKRCFRGWDDCRILGPIGRRMRERRLIRRVARYAEHWRKVATKRSVWRMCHEGYPCHGNGADSAAAAARATTMTPTRTKPRCDPDLLRLSLSSLDGVQSMAQTVDALSVEAAADLVASFATPRRSRGNVGAQTGPHTVVTQRRAPLLDQEQQRRQRGISVGSKNSPLTKTSDFIASLTSVQEKLFVLGQQNRENATPAMVPAVAAFERVGVGGRRAMEGGGSSNKQASDLLAHIRELRRAVEGSLASP
jgi:hypothetical protein